MLSKKSSLLSIAVLLTVAGSIHILRAILGWNMQLSSWQVPIWLSWLVSIIALGLAYHAWKFGFKDG